MQMAMDLDLSFDANGGHVMLKETETLHRCGRDLQSEIVCSTDCPCWDAGRRFVALRTYRATLRVDRM